MDKTEALQDLLKSKATQEQIELLQQALVSGEISIGGNVNQSVIILGTDNTVEITSEALDCLGARPLLGNLERDLSGEEIASGLQRLEAELPLRAPVLMAQFQEQTRRLRPMLRTNPNVLSESARKERLEALAHINSLCLEALDISFNAVATGEVLPEYEARCPFRGLESFRVEDREFFFGREELTKKLIGKIKAYPFLAVLGASGSGKSSLVMAGVIPALNLNYTVIRPGTNPLDALDSARGKSLLVVDQFEELFALTHDEKARADFISALLDLTKSGKVIITLRSDFLGEAGAYRSLGREIQNHLEIIPPMNADELCRAMEGQARWAQLEFEADLSQQILDDVEGEPGAMPLLQHALWELWNRRHGRHLRANEYRTFGGVRQAITSTANNIFDKSNKEEREQLRDIFLRLTRLDDDDEGRDTRRRVPLGDLIPSGADTASISALLDKLANARLIVKAVIDDKTEIEVAHEALIRHWERLQGWLNEDRDYLRLRESVSESAKDWKNSEKKDSFINHRDARLEFVLAMSKNPRYKLNLIERAYLDGCVELRKREISAKETLRRRIIMGLATGLVLAVVLAGFAFFQMIEARTQSQVALARQLAAQAQSVNAAHSSKQIVSALLDVQSMKLYPTGDAASFLINDNHSTIPISHMHHNDRVTAVAFSPDGKYVASGSKDGIAHVWDAFIGAEIARLTHDDGELNDVLSIAFSPDGKYVVSGSRDGTARVWDAFSGMEITRMTHNSYVSSVSFSPNGKYVVSGSLDHTARVWDAFSGAEIARMTHDNMVVSVAFSPDGKYIVSGSSNTFGTMTINDYKKKTARVWEATSGKEVARMAYDDDVWSVAFSPNGRYIVSGSRDNTARVWEASSGIEIARMVHDDSVTSIAFSPNGKYVVSGSLDNTARVWDMLSGVEVARLYHNSGVSSVAFSPDGKYVVSGSADSTVSVWEASSGVDVARLYHNSSVSSVAFSPDGKYIARWSSDNSVLIWDGMMDKEVARLYHDDKVTSVAFSPDGKYVVSGSQDNTARVWEVSSEIEIARMTHDEYVLSVAFSPDGKYIVSGSEDNTARVWEASSGREIARMTHDKFVSYVAFILDGKYIVSESGFDDTERVWMYRPDDLIADACSHIPRNLTRAEWQQYIGDVLPYQAVCPNLPIEPESTSTP